MRTVSECGLSEWNTWLVGVWTMKTVKWPPDATCIRCKRDMESRVYLARLRQK